MVSKETCRDLISGLRRSFDGVDAAYLARIRLKRLVLSCTRMIAGRYGIEEPDLPGPLFLPADASEECRDIANICNNLLAMTSNLCQRSEPLDSRWKTSWTTLLRELDILEVRLSR